MISNFDEIKFGHKRYLYEKQIQLVKQSFDAGERGVAFAKSHPRFTPRHPGGLADSNESKVVVTRSGAVIRLSNSKKYAAAIDRGAKPHTIWVKNASLLHFFWAKKGRWVSTLKVNHPGNKPYRFLYSATLATAKLFGPRLDTALANIKF